MFRFRWTTISAICLPNEEGTENLQKYYIAKLFENNWCMNEKLRAIQIPQ